MSNSPKRNWQTLHHCNTDGGLGGHLQGKTITPTNGTDGEATNGETNKVNDGEATNGGTKQVTNGEATNGGTNHMTNGEARNGERGHKWRSY